MLVELDKHNSSTRYPTSMPSSVPVGVGDSISSDREYSSSSGGSDGKKSNRWLLHMSPDSARSRSISHRGRVVEAMLADGMDVDGLSDNPRARADAHEHNSPILMGKP